MEVDLNKTIQNKHNLWSLWQTVHSLRSSINTPHLPSLQNKSFLNKLKKKITCNLCFISTSQTHLTRGGVKVTHVGVWCGCVVPSQVPTSGRSCDIVGQPRPGAATLCLGCSAAITGNAPLLAWVCLFTPQLDS